MFCFLFSFLANLIAFIGFSWQIMMLSTFSHAVRYSYWDIFFFEVPVWSFFNWVVHLLVTFKNQYVSPLSDMYIFLPVYDLLFCFYKWYPLSRNWKILWDPIYQFLKMFKAFISYILPKSLSALLPWIFSPRGFVVLAVVFRSMIYLY